MIVQPTAKFRWLERKEALSPFFRNVDGGPSFATTHTLQQWWAQVDGPGGEWRDVPVEVES